MTGLRYLLPFALLTLPGQSAPPAAEVGKAPAAVAGPLTDLAGKTHRLGKDTKVVVYLFVSTDCPIANFYQPTLRKLAKKFENRGVRFFQVHPDPDLTAKEAAAHSKEFNVTSPVILDPKQELARKCGAKVTPEAIAYLRDGTLLYRGRIDNTYTAYGKRRPEPTSRDLEAALEAALVGKKVAVPITKAVGCQIFIEQE